VNEAAAARDPVAGSRLLELARLISGPYATVTNTAAELLQLRVALGLPSLASYAQIDIARVVASPSGSLKTNPVALSDSELSAILELALSA